MKKYTFVLWSFLVLAFPALLSAQTVEIPDMTVQRGTIFPVEITVEGIPEGQPISLRVNYPRDLLHFTRAEGGGNHIMLCPTPETTQTQALIDTLTITCSNTRQATEGLLVTLYFEALAGPDSAAKVQADSLKVNNTPVMGVGYNDGIINIPGVPVFPHPIESLSQNYPNPFGFFTTFDYSASDSANIEFSVFSLAGRRVAAEDYVVVVEREKKTVSIEPGFNMANGAYLMQMKTDNGVYQVPFFFIR